MWQPLIKAEGRAVGRCDASTGRRGQSMGGVSGSRSWQMEGREGARGAKRGRRKESGGEASTTCAEREKDRGTNRGPGAVTLPSKLRGLVMGGAIFGHHRRRGSPPLRREKKAGIVRPLEEDSDLIAP